MNGIIQAFKDNLPDVSWMDRTTKKEAMDKVSKATVLKKKVAKKS